MKYFSGICNRVIRICPVLVPINGAEEEHGDFEVFCNNLKVHWVQKDDKRNWIVGGLAADGASLFICRAVHENSIIPGKYYEPTGCCYFGLYKKEYCTTDFTVMAKLD